MSKWKMVKLGEVCTIVSGSTPKTSVKEYWNGTNCWVTPAELEDNAFLVNDTERKITDLAIKETNLKSLPIGTILLSSRAPIGKVAVTGCTMYSNQGFKNLICGEQVYNKYLFWFLKGKTEYLKSLGRGATFKEISKAIVEKIDIPLPPLDIQKHIADTLDKTQEIIDGHKKQIEELDNLIKATFYDMFGDPVTNEKQWEECKLGDICTIVRGGSPRPIEKFLGGTIPWIKIGDATKGDDLFLTSTKEYIIEAGIQKSRYIKSGSMIFANCGVSLGFARIITFDGCIHDGWLAFDINSDNLNKIFLLKQLNEKTEYFRKTAPSGTQPNLNTNIMKNTSIIVPPLYLQEKFTSIVLNIEQQKALVKQSITESQNLFNSLMSKYFD